MARAGGGAAVNDRPVVELVFFAGCPHVASARKNLEQTLTEAAHPGGWREWDLADPRAPRRVRIYSSPTVLVGGNGVAGPESRVEEGVLSCRASGAPTVRQIVASLREAASRSAENPR